MPEDWYTGCQWKPASIETSRSIGGYSDSIFFPWFHHRKPLKTECVTTTQERKAGVHSPSRV